MNTFIPQAAQKVTPDPHDKTGTAGEVFIAALRLGLTSFGGPIAHIGYFERAYVQQRKWLTADEFAGLVALCQLVPGPASSQLGYCIGLRRAGWGGALAAWAGFTMPSALLMFAFALVAPRLSGPVADAVLHGLKLVAAIIVAQAVWSMAKTLCSDTTRKMIAGLAGVAMLWLVAPGWQLAVLMGGGVAGTVLCRHVPASHRVPRLPVGPKLGFGALVLFGGLLMIGGTGHSLIALAAICTRAGALVFGGGHVVLPLLRAGLVPSGWLTDSAFLGGYGAAQAMPGPLFTFAAFIGAAVAPTHAGLATVALWSATALCAIFLPGLLIATAGLSVWDRVNHAAPMRGALAGINAAVVGVLGAAFCTPILPNAVHGVADGVIGIAGLILLLRTRMPPVALVLACVIAAVGERLVQIG